MVGSRPARLPAPSLRSLTTTASTSHAPVLLNLKEHRSRGSGLDSAPHYATRRLEAVSACVAVRARSVALHLRTALRPHPSLFPCQIPNERNSKHRVFDWRRAAGAEITCQDGSNRVRIYFRDVLPYSPRVVPQRIPATRPRLLSLTL